ncbi:MAG: DUF3879 family protein [Lachnospiraceae bacterium]|nr:DUF3879 family protein [Lachnospiraceae bacterium]
MIKSLFYLWLNISIYAGVFTIVVLLFRLILKKKIPAKYLCVMWILVAFRFIIPYSVESPYGILPSIYDVQRFFEDKSNFLEHEYSDSLIYDTPIEINDIDIPKDNSFGINYEVYLTSFELRLKNANLEVTDDNTTYPSLEDIASHIWVIGLGLMLIYMVISTIIVRCKVRYAVPEICSVNMSPYKKSNNIKVYVSDEMEVPFLFGIIKPKIYLPYDIRNEEKTHIIRHEMIHIKRYDNITKPLFFIALALHWYNPFAWLAYILYSRDMELACDEMVIEQYEDKDIKEYLSALLYVAGGKHNMNVFSLSFGASTVKERMKHIAEYKKAGISSRAIALSISVILCISFFTIHTNTYNEPQYGADYRMVVSENYRLEPDDENYCYHIYDKTGTQIGGIIEYGDALPVENEKTKEKYLFTLYKDMNAYDVIILDDELEADLKEAFGEKFWYVRSLSEYSVISGGNIDLNYIVKNGTFDFYGHVLLWNKNDKEIYDALAKDYADRYPEIIPDTDTGYTYADMEVKGLSKRYDDGFFILQTGGTIAYYGVRDLENTWSLALTTDEFEHIEAWLLQNQDENADYKSFKYWAGVFDVLDIEYNSEIDTDSNQYKAAVKELTDIWGEFPPEGMSESQAEQEIRNRMKYYDEDGDYVAFGSLPGMTITDENDANRRTIIDIPEDVRQLMFDLTKSEFIKWKGISIETERSDIFRIYQEQAPKEERLKGSWTLEQYERIYSVWLENAVRADNPEWEEGDWFDAGIIEPITREQIELNIYSDGNMLHILE